MTPFEGKTAPRRGRLWMIAYAILAIGLDVFVWNTIAHSWRDNPVQLVELPYEIGLVDQETSDYVQILRDIAQSGSISPFQQQRLASYRHRILSHLAVLSPYIADAYQSMSASSRSAHSELQSNIDQMQALLQQVDAALSGKPDPAALLTLINPLRDQVLYFKSDTLPVLEDDVVATQHRSNLFSMAIGILFTIVMLSGFAMFSLLTLLRRRNHELNLLAAVDPLTGLLNRRTCVERANAFSALARRRGIALSVAVIDLDHFKTINDSHGHPAGDAVLKASALLIDRSRRDSDIAARLGGEEFALIMIDTDATGALIVCERLRKALEAGVVPYENKLIQVTASIGLATEFGTGADFKTLYSRADQALYRAKTDGRNRTVIADTIGATGPRPGDTLLSDCTIMLGSGR